MQCLSYYVFIFWAYGHFSDYLEHIYFHFKNVKYNHSHKLYFISKLKVALQLKQLNYLKQANIVKTKRILKTNNATY